MTTVIVEQPQALPGSAKTIAKTAPTMACSDSCTLSRQLLDSSEIVNVNSKHHSSLLSPAAGAISAAVFLLLVWRVDDPSLRLQASLKKIQNGIRNTK